MVPQVRQPLLDRATGHACGDAAQAAYTRTHAVGAREAPTCDGRTVREGVITALRVVGRNVEWLRAVPLLHFRRVAQRAPHALDRRVDRDADSDGSRPAQGWW